MVTTRRYTLADLPALPDDDRRYDIVGGELVVRNVPDMNHGALLTELSGLLYAAYQAGYGLAYSSTSAVALDFPAHGEGAEDVSHPDLFLLRAEREHIVGWGFVEGVPDLIIEIISPTTAAEHTPEGALWQAYERNGVPHYWTVDAATRTVRQYALVGEPYVGGHYGDPTILRPGDTLTSPLFPTIELPVATLFRRVRDRPGGSPPRRSRADRR